MLKPGFIISFFVIYLISLSYEVITRFLITRWLFASVLEFIFNLLVVTLCLVVSRGVCVFALSRGLNLTRFFAYGACFAFAASVAESFFNPNPDVALTASGCFGTAISTFRLEKKQKD
jgi:hypothetical protein